MYSCLCFQNSYPYRAMIWQHRMWDVSLRVTMSTMPIPGRRSTWRTLLTPILTSMDAAQTAELWCHHQVPSWEGDTYCWCAIRYSPLIGLEVELNKAISHIHIIPEKKLEFQRTIQDDPLLCTHADTIVTGWPEDIKDIPKALCPYHKYHGIMTVEDRLILKGEAFIVLPLEREKILQAIHEGHNGVNKY